MFGARAWEIVFTATTAWFAVRCLIPAGHGATRRDAPAHHTPHLLGSGAMLYMYLAMPDTGAPSASGASMLMPGMDMAGMGAIGIRYPLIALTLSLALFGYLFQSARAMAVVPADGEAGASSSAHRPFLAPRGAACCQFAMSTVMAYTLLMMLKRRCAGDAARPVPCV
ncbi:MAG: DUF5134 domain-containing protein [Actinocrinis sp.]